MNPPSKEIKFMVLEV